MRRDSIGLDGSQRRVARRVWIFAPVIAMVAAACATVFPSNSETILAGEPSTRVTMDRRAYAVPLRVRPDHWPDTMQVSGPARVDTSIVLRRALTPVVVFDMLPAAVSIFASGKHGARYRQAGVALSAGALASDLVSGRFWRSTPGKVNVALSPRQPPPLAGPRIVPIVPTPFDSVRAVAAVTRIWANRADTNRCDPVMGEAMREWAGDQIAMFPDSLRRTVVPQSPIDSAASAQRSVADASLAQECARVREETQRNADTVAVSDSLILLTKRLTAPIYFEFGDTLVRKRADRQRLRELAAELKRAPITLGVLLIGYADPVGSPAGNDSLSLRRARSVKRILDEVDVPNVTTLFRGANADDLIVPGAGHDQAGAVWNRRVMILIGRPDVLEVRVVK